MFGDLEAAHAFHQAVTEAHAQHAEVSRRHREVLSGLSRNADRAADGFTAAERRNAAAIGAVGREAQCG